MVMYSTKNGKTVDGFVSHRLHSKLGVSSGDVHMQEKSLPIRRETRVREWYADETLQTRGEIACDSYRPQTDSIKFKRSKLFLSYVCVLSNCKLYAKSRYHAIRGISCKRNHQIVRKANQPIVPVTVSKSWPGLSGPNSR